MKPPQSRLRVQLLGEFRCWHGSRLVPARMWKTARIKALLTLLSSERGRFFSQADLAGYLWPNSEPEAAKNSLRRRISDLRRILEPGLKKGRESYYVLQHTHGYSFSAEADCWIDTEEFARLERQGRELEHKRDWSSAASAYAKAARLYCGGYLADDHYEDWVRDSRDHWRARCLYVLTRLSECYNRLGRYQEATESCLQAIRIDPHYEEGHRRLMLYYDHWGERAQALEAYERYSQRLSKELGLSPSPQMEELRQRIIQGTAVPLPQPPLPTGTVPYVPAHLPFVGRETEKAQLQKHIRDAQAGETRLVLLSGEPGVGKTRLAQEVLREIQSNGALVLWGQCRQETAASPYLPLSEALRDRLSHLRDEDLALIKPVWLAEIGNLVPELRTLLPWLRQNPQLAPQQARWRLMEAITQFLAGLAQVPRFEKPLVLWLDDLQWAAPSLIDLLNHLCQRATGGSLCVVGAYRNTDMAAQLMTGLQQSRQIVLSRLSYAVTEQLLASVGPKLAPEFCGFAYRETEGNPLFLMTLLRELFDRKVLTVAADGTWICNKIHQLNSFTGQAIRKLLRQRLARLSSTEERLLQIASVIARNFDYELLKAAWRRDGKGLDRALGKLCEAGFLAATGPGWRYEFTHDRLRETVFEEIGPERSSLHRRVAQALERFHAPELSRYYGQLAYHYDRAGERSQALQYALKHLEEAVAQYYHHEALQAAEIALRTARAPAQSEKIFQILVTRSEVYHRLGRRREEDRDTRELVSLAQEAGSPSFQAAAWRARAIFYSATGQESKAIKTASQLLRLQGSRRDVPKKIEALLLLGTCYWQQCQYDRALEYAQRARALSRQIRDLKSQGDASHLLGQIHAHTGALRRALRSYQRACRNRCEIRDQIGIGYSLNNIANTYRSLGNYANSLDAYRQSLALAEEIGDEQRRGVLLSDLGDLYFFLGDYERALHYAKQACSLLKIVQDVGNGAQALMVAGRAHQGAGRRREALDSFQRARAVFERLKDMRGACHALNSIASIELESSSARQALETYQRALSRLEELGARDLEIDCLTGMSYVYLRLRERVRALKSSQRAIELLETGEGYPFHQHSCFVHHLALRENGHSAEAEKYLQKAYDEVLRRAQTIRDRELRKSFLSRVEMNRAIVESWCRLHS